MTGVTVLTSLQDVDASSYPIGGEVVANQHSLGITSVEEGPTSSHGPFRQTTCNGCSVLVGTTLRGCPASDPSTYIHTHRNLIKTTHQPSLPFCPSFLPLWPHFNKFPLH